MRKQKEQHRSTLYPLLRLQAGLTEAELTLRVLQNSKDDRGFAEGGIIIIVVSIFCSWHIFISSISSNSSSSSSPIITAVVIIVAIFPLP